MNGNSRANASMKRLMGTMSATGVFARATTVLFLRVCRRAIKTYRIAEMPVDPVEISRAHWFCSDITIWL